MVGDAVYESALALLAATEAERESALALLAATEAERDEANAKYIAENQNWTSMYEDWRREKARAEAAEKERDEAREELRKWETHIYPHTYKEALASIKAAEAREAALRIRIDSACEALSDSDASFIRDALAASSPEGER